MVVRGVIVTLLFLTTVGALCNSSRCSHSGSRRLQWQRRAWPLILLVTELLVINPRFNRQVRGLVAPKLVEERQ
jgi:hypothetical protein